MSERGQRKTRTGLVVSDRMQKSVVVSIDETVRHPLYGKTYHRKVRYTAHDEQDNARTGDLVKIMETRPLSKTKRWRVVEVLERAR
ncbi:MAG: 30S ribosomal protein S17 [Acidimicrobiia bacterium]|nr:30S ribosomal protein S17 [Acidimicrobiia bacterium]